MKKEFLMLVVLSLVCTMIVSLGACTGPNQPNTEVTQENVADMFMPSLEAYVYYMGSAFYTVEKDENGETKEYHVERESDGSIMTQYKVMEYNDFEPIVEQMRKYMSEDVCQDVLSGIYEQRDGELYIEDIFSIIGNRYSYDVASIELLESDGDNYKIGVDTCYSEFNTDTNSTTIIDIYKSSFNATLKDGVLVIESFEKGEPYTVEEIKSDTPAEDRRWINPMTKIYDSEPVSLPYDTRLK